MAKKKRRRALPPIDESPEFQELLKDLRQQTPDQLGRLKEMLDERIRRSDDTADGTTSTDR